MRLTTRSFNNTECDITRTTCNIKRSPTRALGRCQPADHRIFPDAMQPTGHEIVHHIVTLGNLMENVVDQPLLGIFIDRFEAE